MTRIEENHDEDAELHNICAYLLNLRELVERSPGLEMACKDLQEAASALAATRNTDGPTILLKRQRLLRAAYLRFQMRLTSARPNERAHHLGLR